MERMGTSTINRQALNRQALNRQALNRQALKPASLEIARDWVHQPQQGVFPNSASEEQWQFCRSAPQSPCAPCRLQAWHGLRVVDTAMSLTWFLRMYFLR